MDAPPCCSLLRWASEFGMYVVPATSGEGRSQQRWFSIDPLGRSELAVRSLPFAGSRFHLIRAGTTVPSPSAHSAHWSVVYSAAAHPARARWAEYGSLSADHLCRATATEQRRRILQTAVVQTINVLGIDEHAFCMHVAFNGL